MIIHQLLPTFGHDSMPMLGGEIRDGMYRKAMTTHVAL